MVWDVTNDLTPRLQPSKGHSKGLLGAYHTHGIPPTPHFLKDVSEDVYELSLVVFERVRLLIYQPKS